MSRKAVLIPVALVLLAVSGTTGAWAAAPFGWFNGIPGPRNAGNGVEPLQGWALADTGVFAVDIVVDGVIIGRANYGRARPGVTKQYPHFPDSAAPGYGYELDTTQFLNGNHTVTARVTSRSGQVVYLNSIILQFTNTNADLLPFGKIEFPNEGAEMIGNCDLSKTRTPLYSIVSGYAMDVNASYNMPGVAYVELEIDNSLIYNSQYDCNYLPAPVGLANCYGIKRLDLEQQFPGLKDAPHAGFRFALDVGALIGTTDDFGTPLFTPGSHQIGIRVGDQFENVTNLGPIAVTFSCRDVLNQDLAIGGIDYPITGLLYGGIIQVSGWAVDLEGVAAVLVYVDGNLLAITDVGLARPDIVADFPGYPEPVQGGPGWYTYIDTTQLSNGVHQLEVQVIDNQNVSSFIGKFPFTVANPIP
jgi:N-acetylmuramoyl-L-alanine amidase